MIAPAVPETSEGVKAIRFGVLKLARFGQVQNSMIGWKSGADSRFLATGTHLASNRRHENRAA